MNTATQADCPKCDPCNPEMDEDGRYYACYFCGDTGRVDAAVAAAYWQDCQDATERFAPRPLGIFYSHDELRDAGEYGAELSAVPGHRLFSRFIRAPRPSRVMDNVMDMGFDDIAF